MNFFGAAQQINLARSALLKANGGQLSDPFLL
jgi:hypothetical protein